MEFIRRKSQKITQFFLENSIRKNMISYRYIGIEQTDGYRIIIEDRMKL